MPSRRNAILMKICGETFRLVVSHQPDLQLKSDR
jgi:hypothetical protein